LTSVAVVIQELVLQAIMTGTKICDCNQVKIQNNQKTVTKDTDMHKTHPNETSTNLMDVECRPGGKKERRDIILVTHFTAFPQTQKKAKKRGER